MTTPIIYPLSENSIVIEWGDAIDETISNRVFSLNSLLKQKPFTGLTETVPAYTTLTIYYQPELINKEKEGPFVTVKKNIEELLSGVKPEQFTNNPVVVIPVCYDDEFGQDIKFIATERHLSKEEIIALHQQKEYRVYMMGFLPGFAYMGKLDDAIATPRKHTPRAIVEAGSVGIAGNQTGIYPLPSPGGWQIIGRTPLCLFDTQKKDPFLFKAGDRVKFFQITKEEFEDLSKQQNNMPVAVNIENTADAIVIRPGMFSTIQDGGRIGFQSFGVPLSGAMDHKAYCIANGLLGNSKNAAVIECTMGGLAIQFKKDTTIAITGAGTAYVNHREIEQYMPVPVHTNDLLEIKYDRDGIRTYIAVSGGFYAPVVMNSRSAYTNAGIGTALRKDDALKFEDSHPASAKKHFPGFSSPEYHDHSMIRIFTGPECNRMYPESLKQLYQRPFKLTNQCDRMGYRLSGEPLQLCNKKEMLSTAVTKGAIQLTNRGQLIILMSDCQTTGGYPRVAQVAAADLQLLAQMKPGDTIQFKNISFREAEELYLSEQIFIDEFFS